MAQQPDNINLLAWLSRLSQTELLVEKRTAELLAHQQRRAELEATLVVEEAQAVGGWGLCCAVLRVANSTSRGGRQ
jgi:hypothetical protein